jgi:mono/diheme cytochrome c family protein
MSVHQVVEPATLPSTDNQLPATQYTFPGNIMTKLIRTILLFLFPLILTACSFSLAEDITPPPGAQQPVVQASTEEAPTGPLYPLVPPDPAAGAADFAEKCAPCHGDTGLGDGPSATDLPVPVGAIGTAAVARRSTPAEWYTLVTKGDLERYMPPFNSLNDRERWDVIAYVYSLSAPAETIALGGELYQANCVQCHGTGGKGDGPMAANLASAPRDFTDQAFMAEYSAAAMFGIISQGIDPMPAYASQLDESEVWAITDYLRSLTFTPQALPEEQVQVESTTAPAVEATEVDAASGLATEVSQPAATPSPTGLGTVIVTLVNGSGGEVPADTTVTLYAFDNMTMAFTKTLSSGVNGVYTFEDIEMLAGRAYLAGVDYNGGTYGSDVATADPAVPLINLQITTYETSSDTSVLTTDRLHIFFDFTDPELLQVVEVYIISNPTDQSVISAEAGGGVVFFPLPDGYQELQFENGALGEQYLEAPGGFVDTTSVPPGMSQYQVVFAFNLPYDRRFSFSQAVTMSTSAVVIMIPDNGVKLSGDLLQDGGVRDFQGTSYRMYNGSNLSAGSELVFEISGRANTGSATLIGETSWQNIAIGVGGLGLVLVLVGLWLYQRNKKAAVVELEAEEIPAADTLNSSDDAESLMDAIIALDDQYQAGELPEDAYHQRRAELKERLQNLKLD